MKIIGLMSGTSIDGVDVAYCDFSISPKGKIDYSLLAAETYSYTAEWREKLRALPTFSACDYALADVQLGHLFGQIVQDFRSKHPGTVDLIASHGHTVFHQPHLQLTTQIGDGNAIAAETHLPVVCDFRRLDVALGGQGAPLVPVGDRLLFGDYQACLNLGGFSNISFDYNQQRVAFDVSPCNMALNQLAARLGLLYDCDGNAARMGEVLPDLLERMNRIPYYFQSYPKSLGKEWYDHFFAPLLVSNSSPQTLLRTVTEHIAQQIANALQRYHIESLLITGGGAKNTFLIERLRTLVPHCRLSIPQTDIIDYKEAIIFALLGFLRTLRKQNVYPSVTGAQYASISGVEILPPLPAHE